MRIGVPKEILNHENRVAALPKTVEKFKRLGFEVYVETRAGKGAFVSDGEYQKAGATILTDADQIFKLADIILKVREPAFNNALNTHEMDMFRENQVLVTFLDPAAPLNHDHVRQLMEKKVTTFTMDGIPGIARAQKMDPRASMGAVAGYKSVIMAAGRFPGVAPLAGTAMGRVAPASILVIGTGAVGLQAVATGRHLGGDLKSVDIRPGARAEAESIGVKVTGFDVPSRIALKENGYANALPDDWIEREQAALAPQVAAADIVILSARVPGEPAPILVTRQMVESMKPGSVIIDASIDQGGNCEVTVPGRESVHQGVTISGIKDIPGSMPVHASWLYANNLYYFIENLFRVKITDEFDMRDEIISQSMVTHRGRLFHLGTRKAMGFE